MSLLASLNKNQREAADWYQGPLLILAGAGSGKTRTLVYRTANLILHYGVKPWQILVVTFTNKAAKELKSRLGRVLQQSDLSEEEVMTGTFHSVCLKILRKEGAAIGLRDNFVIYDRADQVALMKRIFKDLGREIDVTPSAVLSIISLAKSEMLSIEEFRGQASSRLEELAAEVYPLYQKRLKEAGALDFDDILIFVVYLFTTHQEILKIYQNLWQYVMVDEYQDTNRVQYQLVNMLVKCHHNLVVVGDDYQSIYSWRGADIRNILDFEQDYQEARIVRLEQNYRSTGHIIKAANSLIKHNVGQKKKELWTDNVTGERIKLHRVVDGIDEGHKVVSEIKQVREGNGDLTWNDFAILYRTNAQSRVLEEVFVREHIPYQILGGVRFYERREVKDILAYLRIIMNIDDEVSLARIINKPTRGIGAKALTALKLLTVAESKSLGSVLLNLRDELMYPELTGAARKHLTHFADLVANWMVLGHSMPLSALIDNVVRVSGMEAVFRHEGVEGESRLENVQELISVAKSYDNLDPDVALMSFLEEVALVADVDGLADDVQSVKLMTMHSAKGLEFPYVFVVGFEEGLFPGARSALSPEDLEEERRLCYVAITRAKLGVHLLHAESRLIYGHWEHFRVSRFLAELPPDSIDDGNFGELEFAKTLGQQKNKGQNYGNNNYIKLILTVGEIVKHSMWGTGQVTYLDGDIVKILFTNSEIGTKTLSLRAAPLLKVTSHDNLATIQEIKEGSDDDNNNEEEKDGLIYTTIND